MVLVSVIVPCYNHAQFIEERLTSIVNQSFTDYELIVLDDASTDDSVDFIKKQLVGRDYVLHVNQVNCGSPFAQWDRGISLATGELIWIAESDNSCSPDFLSKLVDMYEQTGASLLYSESLLIDAAGEVVGDTLCYTDNLDPYLSRYCFTWPGISFVLKYLSVQCVFPNASAVLFSRECYEVGLVSRYNLHLSGDWLQWIAVSSKGYVTHSNEKLNYFRQHSGSVRSRTQEIVEKESLVCTQFALSFLSGNERPAFLRGVACRMRSRWRFNMPISLLTQPHVYIQKARILSRLMNLPILYWGLHDTIKLLLKPFVLLSRWSRVGIR